MELAVHSMSDDGPRVMASARDVLLHEWSLRRPVQFDTSGGWHKCSRDTCTIMQLKEFVCLHGHHVAAQNFCTEHQSACVLVDDLYVCKQVGCAHVCNQRTCQTVSGRCIISGLSCVEQPVTTVNAPQSNKRTRRRSPNVHTCHQSANILLYDLLFSHRRMQAEIHRTKTVLDVARRMVQRKVRKCVQNCCQVNYQELIDIFADARLKVGNIQHFVCCQDEKSKREVCEFYASYIMRIWNRLISYLPVRSMFEPIAAAILYSMRRGIAYDGLLAIPNDIFLACALPDAHAIKDVDINRRIFTQSKNALFQAIQSYVHQKGNSVEIIASEFRTKDTPSVILQNYNGVIKQ